MEARTRRRRPTACSTPKPPARACFQCEGLRRARRGSAGSFHVLALDADQPGRAVAPRRVQIAFIVEIRHAGFQRVVLDPSRLPRFSLAGARDRLIVGHYRFAARLAVDRPGRAVIVRIAVLGALVDVAEDAEIEFRILVQHLALGHVVREVGLRRNCRPSALPGPIRRTCLRPSTPGSCLRMRRHSVENCSIPYPIATTSRKKGGLP